MAIKDALVRFFMLFKKIIFIKHNLDALLGVEGHLVADQLKDNIYIHVRKNISITMGKTYKFAQRLSTFLKHYHKNINS